MSVEQVCISCKVIDAALLCETSLLSSSLSLASSVAFLTNLDGSGHTLQVRSESSEIRPTLASVIYLFFD